MQRTKQGSFGRLMMPSRVSASESFVTRTGGMPLKRVTRTDVTLRRRERYSSDMNARCEQRQKREIGKQEPRHASKRRRTKLSISAVSFGRGLVPYSPVQREIGRA